MPIKRTTNRKNKFDDAVTELNSNENSVQKKSDAVVKNIIGDSNSKKVIIDKNGRSRHVKVTEKRKTFPVYIPENLYKKFDEITNFYGISKNAAICQLIRDYVTEKKDALTD